MLQMCANCCFSASAVVTFRFLFTFRTVWAFRVFDFSTFRVFRAKSVFLYNFSTCRFSTFRTRFGILHLSAPTAVREHSIWRFRFESPSGRECISFLMSRNLTGGVFKIYDEPESPNEGACLRYMMG